MRVFLGGTAPDQNDYREIVMPRLEEMGIDYFNPIVEDWNEEARRREEEEKITCDYFFCPITNDMVGPYSIAEAVDFSYKKPGRVIFVNLYQILPSIPTTEKVSRSLEACMELLERNGAYTCRSLEEAYGFLYAQKQMIEQTISTTEEADPHWQEAYE